MSVGSFVIYSPTRVDFARSSNSYAHRPAGKRRPCLVSGLSTDGEHVIAPLLGARKLNHMYGPLPAMNIFHWSPVELAERPEILVPMGTSSLTSQPIYVCDDRRQQPVIPLKPSYIWTGDEGEVVPDPVFYNLPSEPARGQVHKRELRFMRKVNRKTFEKGLSPPTGSGIQLQPLSQNSDSGSSETSDRSGLSS